VTAAVRSSSHPAPGRRFRLVTAAVGVALGLGLSGCSDTASGDVTAITATDDACEVAVTDLKAGKNSFEVANEGDKVTEVYVYGEGDRVVTERENIGPGTKATFNADLAAGSYEIACKPGQTGDGIRQTITVTGEGRAAAPTRYDREIELGAEDYSFTGLDDVTIAKGETIEFKMTNGGKEQHEFEVFAPDGRVLGEIGPTASGQTGEVILAFEEAGTYKVVCGIEDHEERGMVGTLAVS